jgi:hypothetical protein
LYLFINKISSKAESSLPNEYSEFIPLEANGSHSIGVSAFTAGGTRLDHLLLTMDTQIHAVSTTQTSAFAK